MHFIEERIPNFVLLGITVFRLRPNSTKTAYALKSFP
jgi:hypothetical protein